MPEVSVIIPTHNREKFIERTIRSVLCQTFKDYEVIMVDDGSTDNTPEIVKQLDSGKIKYIYQAHKERSSARNNGIMNSSGKYIAFLDSDDTWLPEKLELQVKTMEKDKECGFVYTDLYIEDINGRITGQHSKKHLCPSGNVFESLYVFNFIVISTVMVRRSVINEVGMFNEGYTGVEDYDLWLRILSKHKARFINKPLAVYCSHMWTDPEYETYIMKETAKLLKKYEYKKD